MLHCIKIKGIFCAMHDEKNRFCSTWVGDLAHGIGCQHVYRAVAA